MIGLRQHQFSYYNGVKKSLFSQSSLRYITIQQPSTVVTTKPVSLEITKNEKVNEEELPVIESQQPSTIESPSFKTIGTPASSLSVTVPPSIPIHVKKGSIISVYSYAQSNQVSHNNDFVRSKWEISEPLRRLWLAGKASSYQSVISTVPIQVLVSAYDGYEGNKVSGVKSFVNLTLDGTLDWVVFKPEALQCYTGNSLNVKVSSLPKELRYGFKGRGYIWINGRGLVSFVGNGSVFKVGLGEGEEIRVARDNILAVSINDLADLSNNSINSETWNSFDGLLHEKKDIGKPEKDKIKEIKEVEPIKLFNNKVIDDALTLTWKYTKTFVDILKGGKSQLTDYIMGSGHYVVVKGPRTILIETGSGRDNFVVKTNELFSSNSKNYGQNAVSELENNIKNENEWKKPDSKVGDNLGVVTIKNGKATYKNLDNFDEEVTRIENLKNRKA